VTEGAKAGEFRLQVCADCGQVQYPPREVCGECLSENLDWQAIDGKGTVLSHTRLKASVEPYFQARLPIDVVSVRLDVGPVLYAFAGDGTAETGTPVMIEARIDEAGVGVLHAKQRD
jgi:uncharacterized OB-fold protein